MAGALGCLLKRALTTVPRTVFEYRTVVSVSTNEIGNTIATYTEWKKAEGSVQPGLTFSFNARGISSMIDLKMARRIGIDMAKELITVYAKGLDLKNVHFQTEPDQIRYDGRIFNIMSISNWLPYEGWKSLVCVEDTREQISGNDSGVSP